MFNSISTEAILCRPSFSDIRQIIGIQASLKDFSALEIFFSKLPDKTQSTFIIVQPPTDSGYISAEKLSSITRMHVVEARHLMPLEINTVYVLPAAKLLTVRSEHFILSDDYRSEHHFSDIFFNALSDAVGERAIAIFCSGNSLDGVSGASSIRENGGIVMLLGEQTDANDVLHSWLMSNGSADFVYEASSMADELMRLINLHPEISVEVLDLESFKQIYLTLKLATGIDFTHYKHNIIVNAVKRHMAIVGLSKLSDYTECLAKQNQEIIRLSREILIGVTRFFRDSKAYEKLKATALRRIICDTAPGATVRIWSTGCSTGEEAYSLAILIDELMKETGQRRNVKIFATDVNVQAVSTAAKGEFASNIIGAISPERLQKYFTPVNGKYRIADHLRKMITFAPHDLFRDPPFRNLDLVVCRNVLIYFQSAEQKALFSIFHSALKPGAFLFLGRNESASEYATVFKAVSSSEKIYAHVSADASSTVAHSPTFRLDNLSFQTQLGNTIVEARRKDFFFVNTYTRFLERFLPASVIITADDTIVHFFGDINEYLVITPGQPSLNLFDLLNQELKLVVSTALSRCRNNNAPVAYSNVRVSTSQEDRHITVSAYPVPDSGRTQELTAIIFSDRSEHQDFCSAEKYDADQAALRRISNLELELYNSRKELGATIRELEVANEELQAGNEELQTSNEELHNFNSDLKSTNEELRMIHLQDQDRFTSLSRRSKKFSDCLSVAHTGILITDTQLNIRGISKFLSEEFELCEHDVGRTVQIFTLNFPMGDLMSDIQNAFQQTSSQEIVATAQNGFTYRVRIACDRDASGLAEGVVLIVTKLNDNSGSPL